MLGNKLAILVGLGMVFFHTTRNKKILIILPEPNSRQERPMLLQIAAKMVPLKVGYSYVLLNGSFHETVESTWQALGIPHTPDANGGHVRGFTVWQSTLDREANVRDDAARAYYYPFQSRPNLRVYLNTIVNRIVWNNSSSHDVVADGVEIKPVDGTVRVLKAKREVILSAGSLTSPAVLELFGVEIQRKSRF